METKFKKRLTYSIKQALPLDLLFKEYETDLEYQAVKAYRDIKDWIYDLSKEDKKII